MFKTIKRIKFDSTHDICKVRYDSPPCESSGVVSKEYKKQLLETIYTSHGLDLCDGYEFEKLKMFYDKNKWSLEIEATIPARMV